MQILPRIRSAAANALTGTVAALITASFSPAATGASASWTGTGNGAWTNTLNWDNGVPSVADTATFSGAGNGNTTIDLGTGVSVLNVLFDSANVAAYTIGSGAAGSQTLTLGNSGSISVSATVTTSQEINAGLVLGTNGSTQTVSISNNSVSSGQLLTFAGSMSGSNGVGVKTLNVSGGGLTVISGKISDGIGGGSVALRKTGAGVLTLNSAAANTYTGGTTIRQGTLLIDFANAGVAADLLNPASSLILQGGSLQVKQKTDVATSQSFNSVTLASGSTNITALNSGTGIVNVALGDIGATRASGATSNFVLPTSGSIGTLTVNTNRILGPWATIGTGTAMTYAKNDGAGSIAAAVSGAGNDINTGVTEAAWDGSGTLNYQLTGAITLSGNRSVNALRLAGAAQVMTLGNFTASVNGILSVGSGTSLSITRGTGTSGALVIGANRELVVAGPSNLVVSAPIADNGAGASSLTYSGSGILNLTGTNTYTGTTTINAGTLRIGNGGTTGSIMGGNIVDNATLEVSRTDVFNLPNVISGMGGVNKISTGTLVLGGNNSYEGVTTVSAGIVAVGNNNGLGSTVGGTSVVSGAMLVLQNGVTVTGETVTVAGTGIGSAGPLVADSNATATWAGPVNLGGINGRVGAKDGGVLIVSGPIQNGTDFAISTDTTTPTGTVVISGTNNTYTGATQVTRGTLKLGANNALPITTTLDVHSGPTTNPATFDLAGFNQTVGALQRSDSTGNSTITNSSSTPSTLTVDGAGFYVYNGSITGAALSISKPGASSLTLSGNNNFGGTTTIGGGQLTIGAGGTTGTLGSGPIVNNGTLEINRSDAIAATNNISGSGQVNVTGTGVVTMSGTNTYSGPTNVFAGRLNLGGTFTSNIALSDGTAVGGEGSTTGTLTFTGANSLFFDPSTPAALTASSIAAASATVTLKLAAGSPAASGMVVLNAPGGITGTVGTNFFFTGRGTTYLNSAKTQLLFDYTPAALVWKGTAVSDPTAWDLGTTANWQNGATTDTFLTGDSVTFDDTSASNTVIAQGAGLEAGNITFNNSTRAYTILGGSVTSTGTLVKNGSNKVTLGTTMGFAGGTTINAGSIQLGDGNAATGSLGTAPITNNGTLIADLTFNNVTLSNVISGTGSFVLNSGVVAITGANTYSGGTTINGGSLQIATGGTVGTGAINNNGALFLTRSGTYSFPNSISGSGTLASQSGGIVTLTGTNTFSGGTTINSGAIILTANNQLGDATGGTIVSNNAALALSGGVNYSSAEPLTISGPGLGDVNAFFPGSINQRGAIQSLSGNNTFAGNITLGSGTNTRIGIQDGASLTLTGTITDNGAGYTLIFRGGTATAGLITLSGIGNTWARTDIYGAATRIAVNDGLPMGSSLYIGTTGVGTSIFDLNGFNQTVTGLSSIGTTASSNVITNNGAADSILTLNGTTNISFPGVITDGPTKKVSLVKAGTFAQTITGVSTYTGPTNITGGSLTLGVGGGLSGTTGINISGGATFNVSALSSFPLNNGQTLAGGTDVTAGNVVGKLTINSGARIAPGLAAGTTGILNFTSDLNLGSNAHLSLDLNGTTAGSGYDQVVVSSGNITLAGDLAGSTLNFAPAAFADVFYLIVNGGAGTTTGTLGGIAEGGSLFIGSQQFLVSYKADFGGAGFVVNGLGNDVAIMAVPEPGVAPAVIAGMGVLIGMRRRRR